MEPSSWKHVFSVFFLKCAYLKLHQWQWQKQTFDISIEISTITFFLFSFLFFPPNLNQSNIHMHEVWNLHDMPSVPPINSHWNFCHPQIWKLSEENVSVIMTYAWQSSYSLQGLQFQLSSSWNGVLNQQD